MESFEAGRHFTGTRFPSGRAHCTEPIPWLSSEEWGDHRRLALPDDARSFTSF